MDEFESSECGESVICISSSEDGLAEDWETDCSTDTEQMIAHIQREVTTSPMLLGGKIITSEIPEEVELMAGPSTSRANVEITPKLDQKYFDLERCYAPSKRTGKSRIELYSTILPVLESPMSPPDHEKGPSQDDHFVQPIISGFHASYHIQNTRPYDNLSSQRYTGCMVCGKAVDEIKEEKINWYTERSTPRGEPEFTRESSFLYAQLVLGTCLFRHFLWSFVRISVIFTFVWSPSWWHPRLGCHDPTDSFPLHFRNQNVISCLNRRQFFAPTRSALILHHGRVSSTNIASKLFSLRMKTLLHFLLLFRGLSQAVVG